MDWLSQNWIWIAVAAAVLYLFFHHRGFHGLSRSNADPHSVPPTHGDAEAFVPIDPVSHQRLPTDATISSVYQGRAYYFENRENRDAFEREPGKYLAGSTALGRSLGTRPDEATARPRRRGGCC